MASNGTGISGFGHRSVPSMGMGGAHFNVNDPVAANLTLFDMFESDLRQEYQGVEPMFLHVHAGQGIHMRTDEVRAPADMAGKKMRIPTRTGACFRVTFRPLEPTR